MVWIGDEIRLTEFHQFLNTLDGTLKFTMEIGGNTINFLDLKITIISNQLFTTVYSKPTDSHLYLQGSSCHQKASINGIQKGVALRLRRICSSTEEYDVKSKEYSAYLIARGHNPNSVQQAFADVRTVSRADARKKKTKDSSNSSVIFATKFNPRGPNAKAIIKKHSHLLRNSASLTKIFPNGVMVASGREQNLKELLTRADPYSIKDDLLDKSKHGYKRCTRKSCDSCDNFVLETDSIISNATGKRYKIMRDITCVTKYVIYCAICMKCHKQGVGSTFAWKKRLANYKNHIKGSILTCSIVKHFTNTCVDKTNPVGHLKFIILDVLNNTDNLTTDELDDLLLAKEKFWIGTLVTQHSGMNSTHDWNRKTRSEKAINQ